jgi:diguanylate cyclase (GGDEF)-like protein
LADGIREVLARTRTRYTLEYSAGGSRDRRWFVVDVTRFEDGTSDWAVVEQQDITDRKRSELEVERSRATYRELATRDELTGSFNRRAMDRMLEEEVNRHQRYGTAISLIMADIDHFKVVNDTHGHPVGDGALRWLADLLAKNVRVVDRVARYGGEEFAIIAPEQTIHEAFAMAERLRQLIAAHPYRCRGADGASLEIPITVSLGVAAIGNGVEDLPTLIAAADKALYAAKRCGRNCTVQFDEVEDRVGR